MDSVVGIAVGISIVLGAGFIQGLTSFGFALVSVPLLSTFLPVAEVVPLVVLLSLGTNLVILAGAYRDVEFRKIWVLVAASFVAAPLGTLALVSIPPTLIKGVAGVLIVAVSLLMLAGRTFPVKSERTAFVPVGLLSGFLNGSISMSGPPVALFLSNQKTRKETFRASITIYAILLNGFTLVTFFFTGLLTRQVAVATGWLVPSMILGVLLGNLAVQRLSQQVFRKLALFLILGSGLWTLWQVFGR
jgi:uncharacterized membrane protein YfcA